MSNDILKENEELKARLKEIEDKYTFLVAALDNLPNPIFMKDEQARFIFFNEKYAESFKMERGEYIGKSVLDLDYLPEPDRRRYQEEDVQLIEDSGLLSYEVDFDFFDGKEHPSFYWSKGVNDPISGKKGLVGEIVDISNERDLQEELKKTLQELKEANIKLEKNMEIDAGTGVFNRVALNKETIRLNERGSRDSSKCAILADLDHFKDVNDEFGHVEGDEILLKFANILRAECRSNDIPIRYGGDEFLIILNDADMNAGKAVAERICDRCREEIKLANGKPLTASLGVAMIEDGMSMGDVIKVLDARLYKAKEDGRNCVASE